MQICNISGWTYIISMDVHCWYMHGICCISGWTWIFAKSTPRYRYVINLAGPTLLVDVHFQKKKIPQVQICNVSGWTCIFHIKNWNPIICMYLAGPAFLVSTQCPPKISDHTENSGRFHIFM